MVLKTLKGINVEDVEKRNQTRRQILEAYSQINGLLKKVCAGETTLEEEVAQLKKRYKGLRNLKPFGLKNSKYDQKVNLVTNLLDYYDETLTTTTGERALMLFCNIIPGAVPLGRLMVFYELKNNAKTLDNIIKVAYPNLLDWNDLYKNKHEDFKVYFTQLGKETQKTIITKLIQSKQKNKELDAWLSTNHKRVVEEAGRNLLEKKDLITELKSYGEKLLTNLKENLEEILNPKRN